MGYYSFEIGILGYQNPYSRALLAKISVASYGFYIGIGHIQKGGGTTKQGRIFGILARALYNIPSLVITLSSGGSRISQDFSPY